MIKAYIQNKYRVVNRRLYWLFRLMQARKGSGFTAHFPVRVEGSGTLTFGKNCKIGKNAYFACAADSKITFGNNCKIDEGAEIYTNKGNEIIFGDNVWIMKNTIIRTGSKFEFGNDVAIATNCAVFSRESGHFGELQVGNGTHIGDNTIIDLSDNLQIGEEVAVGPNCVIYTHDHNYTHPDKPAWKGGVVKHPVKIKSGAWVGSSVTVLPKVEIGERCVIAAGAVVTKSTEANAIYGGVPAKKIKDI